MAMRALGIIETVGMAAAIEAADTAVKSANVRLLGYELSKGGGMVTIRFEGDVGAVKAALEAATAAAQRVGEVYSKLMIPRPHDELAKMIYNKDVVGPANPAAQKQKKPAVQAVPVSGEKPQAKPEAKAPVVQEPVDEIKPAAKPADEPVAKPIKEPEPSEQTQQIELSKEDFSFVAVEPEEDLSLPFSPRTEKSVKKNANETERAQVTGQNEEVCNICFDPKCPRKKGDLRTACIHYKDKRRHK